MSPPRAAALGALLLLLAPSACQRQPNPEQLARLGLLRAEQEELWKRFNDVVAGDPLLAEVLSDEGEVLVALRAELLQRTLEDVARQYLDRVELDLPLGARVEAQGEIRVNTAFGRLKAGSWNVDLQIERVRGVLRAKKPEVNLAATDRIALKLPVALQEGSGSATIHFAWDSAGIANAVCRDFSVTRKIDGTFLPETYMLNGELRLSATEEILLAQPSFPDRRFRLKFDLTPESWSVVAEALTKQDQVLKCGIALNPDDVLEKLRVIAQKGFDVRLPQSLFRSVRLPASLKHSAEVRGRRYSLAVSPNALRMEHAALWLSARVQLTSTRPPAERLVASPSSPR